MTTPPKSNIDAKLVRELATILQDADLGEIEIEHEGLRIRVSRAHAGQTITAASPSQVQYMAAPNLPAPIAAAPSVVAAPISAAATEPQPAQAIAHNAVKSPMVGTVYLSPEPEAKAFVNIGDKVSKGDTLLLIEAMKTFNPVIAPQSGTVSQILVTDGQPVEYGEPLLVLS